MVNAFPLEGREVKSGADRLRFPSLDGSVPPRKGVNGTFACCSLPMVRASSLAMKEAAINMDKVDRAGMVSSGSMEDLDAQILKHVHG